MLIKTMLFSGLLFLCYCDFKKNNEKYEKLIVSDSGRPHAGLDTFKRETLCYAEFKKKTKIEVISIRKQCDSLSTYFPLFERSCQKWSLVAKGISDIILLSEEITGAEWHYDYDVLPCLFEGEFIMGAKKASYSVNAGAVTNIVLSDTALTLGYKLKDSKKYFLRGRVSPADY